MDNFLWAFSLDGFVNKAEKATYGIPGCHWEHVGGFQVRYLGILRKAFFTYAFMRFP
jgi:hypothetical protein